MPVLCLKLFPSSIQSSQVNALSSLKSIENGEYTWNGYRDHGISSALLALRGSGQVSFRPCQSSSAHQARLSNLSLCTLLALGICTANGLWPCKIAFAGTSYLLNDAPASEFTQSMASSSPSATFLQSMSLDSCKDSRWLVGKSWAGSDLLEDHSGHMQTVLSGEDHGRMTEKSKSFPKNLNVSHMFPLSSSESLASEAFLDYAGVLSPSRAASLEKDLTDLEKETGWKIRVVTKSGRAASVSGKDLKELWKPDEKTVVIIEDISSPNILNFNAGKDVLAKLPRQFFLELQSRYGNKFFVEQEGEGEALVSTVGAIRECLHRPEGCKNVPGLTSDLYFLTLATSIAGGCVFGFAARLPPQGRVEASWQWVLYLSPLWLLLFGAFGILPVVGRTGELEPLIKNVVGFAGAAFALYLTPIFGPSPISRR